MLKRLLRNQSGATAIEYALIAALIGVAIVASVGGLGDSVNAMFTDVGTEVDGVNQ
jgi:pilus assembly protein Flp/PilA